MLPWPKPNTSPPIIELDYIVRINIYFENIMFFDQNGIKLFLSQKVGGISQAC